MTHHQGMCLVALADLLHDRAIQRRFHAEPIVEATELLLQERIPRGVPTSRPRAEEVKATRTSVINEPPARRYGMEVLSNLQSARARTHLLSNGTYSAMVTTNGSGFSSCGGLAVNRWHPDPTRDDWGFFCYLRDVRSGAVWSAGFQPALRLPQSYEVSFTEDKAEISREDVEIVTRTEIIVSPEDNVELRRLSLTNHSSRTREIDVTSYLEVVLSPRAADVAHRAFNNLFVETEVLGAGEALLARRRPRTEKEEPVWCVHTVAAEGKTTGPVQHETDRARFLGRGRTPADPVSVVEDRQLSNTAGPVLDPILSLRTRLLIEPDETARIVFTVGVAFSRQEAFALAAKYRDAAIFDREATLAWTRSRVELRHMNIRLHEAYVFQRLAGRVMYPGVNLRPPTRILAQNRKSQSGLWAYGIGGDLPIVLVRISDARGIDFIGRLFRAYSYWKLKRFPIDLVVLNEHSASYLQTLQDEIQALARKSGLHQLIEKHDGVHLLRADIMPAEDRILLLTAARVSLAADQGSLEAQLLSGPAITEVLPAFIPRWPRKTYPAAGRAERPLRFFNGLGGFSPEGDEYVISLGTGQWTPAPWVNVVSNSKGFGFLVSESGGGYTWSLNSRENRLTPWSNDPVSDPAGEAIYIRDEDSGSLWTATPLPIRESGSYTIRHGQGYTVFAHSSNGIDQELEQFVPLDSTVKVSVLRLANNGDRERRLSVTSYCELVLGENREKSAPFILTDIDPESGAVVARNCYSAEFSELLAFAAASGEPLSVTCDRGEFLGPGGSAGRPAALGKTALSGRTETGNDPCIAIQSVVQIPPRQTASVVLLLGQAESIEAVRTTAARFSTIAEAEAALDDVKRYWQDLLGRMQVRTPDPALDVLMNGWLLYQVLSCRLEARSAFYQSGGAYGFRDQLQDVMALVYARPDLAREHILRAAGRQFKEGDVQHWWHPPAGRGLRTRISDDAIWLAYVASFYATVTGDYSILDEEAPFLEGSLLTADQNESYATPAASAETGTVFEHCARALERSLGTGVHGLPLIGSGDWNDGMNNVGSKGKGESAWLGWFLHSALESFQRFCEQRGQTERAARFGAHMAGLRGALEETAWDGSWYRRAYFDDGTPLGSAQNEECRIDSISQSWAVISQAADAGRAAVAMNSVSEQLVKTGDGLVVLLTPPFDKSSLEPGYIKGYIPGIRENGGQYSHAAMWTVIAFAMIGNGDRAGEILGMLNPINHSSSWAGSHRYRVEPYVVAGDVYSVPPHVGRGGWTWYTGSASWMYRAALEFVLGFKLNGDRLRIDPCVPRNWGGFEIDYRYHTSRYSIRVENPLGVSRGIEEIELDGSLIEAVEIPLADDGRTHQIRVLMGERQTPKAPHQPVVYSHEEKND
jgi:cyclic beta-1,2-glucan synthetase